MIANLVYDEDQFKVARMIFKIMDSEGSSVLNAKDIRKGYKTILDVSISEEEAQRIVTECCQITSFNSNTIHF